MDHVNRAEKLLARSGNKPPSKDNVKDAIASIKDGLYFGEGVDGSGKPKISNKNKAKANALLGDAYSELGDTGKAIVAYETASKLDTGRHDYALKLADAYYKKG
jgi:tetratricopeptide (TPR) repeat protein